MKKVYILIIVLVTAFSALAQSVTLDGYTATYKDIIMIADGAKVEIAPDALERVRNSHNTLIKAAESGHMIYGLTVGVGLNKDQKMVDATGRLSVEVIKASQEFNKGLIHAHCGGTGNQLDLQTTRAIMAVRLNNMLYGGSGVQQDVVLMLQNMLNSGITPLFSERGSIGEGDITILGHLGLVMTGEGNALYKGKIVKASDALKKEKLTPVTLYAKDALSIVSSNAYSAGMAVVLMSNIEQLIKVSKLVYAHSLEAFNGNIAPFSEEASLLRPFPSFVAASGELRALLKDSYLWNRDDSRALQDPLSFRDSAYYIAALEQSFNELNVLMQIQMNSSDDNPGVLTDITRSGAYYQQARLYVDGGGAVVPNANFEPVLWVLAMEKMSLTVGANSTVASQRTVRLSDDYFTGLTRFLGTDSTVHAFGAMQKPFTALNAENMYLSNPILLNHYPVAGNIEDIATNAPLVVQKTKKQVDNLFQIYGIELIHAAQAIDLRKNQSGFKMAESTERLYNDFRKTVSFMNVDRPLTDDFEKAFIFLKQY